MSNAIFPILPGLKWDQAKTALFSTIIQVATSGREYRIPLYVYPLYEFDLSYEILRDNTAQNELKTLVGFYLQRQGAYDDFLYIDPSDNYIQGSYIGSGTGNNANNSFQLIRVYGGFAEPMYDIQASNSNGPINVYLNGNVQPANSYSINYLKSGVLTFNAANTPPNGAVITADFSYYYRVRFTEFQGAKGQVGGGDMAFSQFMYNLWEVKSVTFSSTRLEGNTFIPPTGPPNVQMIQLLLQYMQAGNLYQGATANDPNTAGLGTNQLGWYWLVTGGPPVGPHYKWWNGNQLLILG